MVRTTVRSMMLISNQRTLTVNNLTACSRAYLQEVIKLATPTVVYTKYILLHTLLETNWSTTKGALKSEWYSTVLGTETPRKGR